MSGGLVVMYMNYEISVTPFFPFNKHKNQQRGQQNHSGSGFCFGYRRLGKGACRWGEDQENYFLFLYFFCV